MSNGSHNEEMLFEVDNALHALAGYCAFRIYGVADQLGICEVLDEPKSCNELANILTLAKGSLLEETMNVLKLSGIVNPHGDRFFLSPKYSQTAASLIENAQASSGFEGVRPLVDVSAERLAGMLNREQGPIDPTECLPAFDAAMGSKLFRMIRAYTIGKALSLAPKTSSHKILVIGGGTGYDALEYSKHVRDAEITVVRNQEFLPQSRLVEDIVGLSNVTNIGLDEVAELEAKHDLVILDVMSEFSPGIADLLKRTRRAVAPKAVLVAFSITTAHRPAMIAFAGLNGFEGMPERALLAAKFRAAGYSNPWFEGPTNLLFGATKAMM